MKLVLIPAASLHKRKTKSFLRTIRIILFFGRLDFSLLRLLYIERIFSYLIKYFIFFPRKQKMKKKENSYTRCGLPMESWRNGNSCEYGRRVEKENSFLSPRVTRCLQNGGFNFNNAFDKKKRTRDLCSLSSCLSTLHDKYEFFFLIFFINIKK